MATAAAEKIAGRCLCDDIVCRVTERPRDVHHCHCGMRRRATGAGFATIFWVPRSALQWRGEPRRHRSSSIASRGFCPTCGTSLFLDYDGSQEIALMLAALDQPERFVPSHHYGVESKLAWVDVLGGLAGARQMSTPAVRNDVSAA